MVQRSESIKLLKFPDLVKRNTIEKRSRANFLSLNKISLGKFQVNNTNQTAGDPFLFIAGLSAAGTSTTASSPSNPSSQSTVMPTVRHMSQVNYRSPLRFIGYVKSANY